MKGKSMTLLKHVGRSLGLALLAAPVCLAFGDPEPASAQTAEVRLNLEVKNVDLANSCVGTGFRPEFKITNFGTEPFILTRANVRMFFNNPLQQPIEFVNADFVRIFNPNGSLTGTFAQAFHFQGPPPNPPCVATPARVANQAHFIAFQSLDSNLVTIPPNGGFATVVVSLRRDGGLAPFDAGCDDFSKLQLQDPSRPFRNDSFFSLVETNPMGPPIETICEFTSPTSMDPLTGVDPCTNTTGCD
jgi:hypothetical protein